MKSKPANPRLIDGSVLLTMATCAVIALFVIAFRFKDYTPCTPAAISVQPGPKYVGEIVRFKAITKNKEKSFIWDFGDDSPFNERGIAVGHIFTRPGRYEVALNADQHCNAYTTIYVLKTRHQPDVGSQAIFMAPETAKVGVPAIFQDATPHATKWEWRFGETNVVDATRQKAAYTFKTPGTKKVILMVNDKMRGEWLVLVMPRSLNPRPQSPGGNGSRIKDPVNPGNSPAPDSVGPPEDTGPKEPDVSDQELRNILTGMVEGDRTMADLSKYFCDASMQVTLNGDLMSLDKLQEKLRKIKKDRKIKELEVSTEKDADRGCVKAMQIKLDRKGIFR